MLVPCWHLSGAVTEDIQLVALSAFQMINCYMCSSFGTIPSSQENTISIHILTAVHGSGPGLGPAADWCRDWHLPIHVAPQHHCCSPAPALGDRGPAATSTAATS